MPRLYEVLDKGKAAAVTTIGETKDKETGKVIFENQSTVFIRGAGGFGGRRSGKGRWTLATTGLSAANLRTDVVFLDRGPATASNAPPQRKPDAIIEEKTLPTQAALYRCVCTTPLFRFIAIYLTLWYLTKTAL